MTVNDYLIFRDMHSRHKVYYHVKHKILKLNFLQIVIHMWLISVSACNHMQCKQVVKHLQSVETDALLYQTLHFFYFHVDSHSFRMFCIPNSIHCIIIMEI